MKELKKIKKGLDRGPYDRHFIKFKTCSFSMKTKQQKAFNRRNLCQTFLHFFGL